MALEIARKDNSSLDENIEALPYNDNLQILQDHPSIPTLIFNSSSGKSKPEGWFIAYLKTKNIIHKFPKGIKPLQSEIEWSGRKLCLIVVYSTSRRAANRIYLNSLVEMYRKVIVPSKVYNCSK